MLPLFKGEFGMDKDKAKEKIEELKETYKMIEERIQELKEQKFRLEGQFTVYNELANEEDEIEEVKNDEDKSLEKEDE